MKKGTIYGIGNEDRYTYFELKKEKSILLRLVKLISLLDKQQGTYAGESFIEYEKYDENYEKVERIKIKISDLVDEKYHFSDKEFDIDIIFGKNEVFLIMYASKSITKSVKKFVGENFEFVKPKKSKRKVIKKK